MRTDIPHWVALLRPLADASMALGGLARALETTPLHQAWLWRETARAAAKISQLSGHRIRLERLMSALAGVPLEPADDDAGLAAARRVFLVAAPLFRAGGKVDSEGGLEELFEPLWPGGATGSADARPNIGGCERGPGDLWGLVRDLATGAGLGDRPALLDILIRLNRRGRIGRAQERFALPLAIQHAGILPKAVPGLLAGRLSFADEGDHRITAWLVQALDELSREAMAASRRLAELEHQHRTWRQRLSSVGLRGHSRLPAVLDCLAATPALSASLVARHLGCSPQGAGAMLRQLVGLGVIKSVTPRARWKIYLAADLTPSGKNGAAVNEALSFSEPAPAFDREATSRLLDELLFDLERLERRTRLTLADTEN